MKKRAYLPILFMIFHLLSTNNVTTPVNAEEVVIYNYDFEKYSLGTTGFTISGEQEIWFQDSETFAQVVEHNNSKMLMYEVVGKSSDNYSKFGGIGVDATNNLSKLVEGTFYEVSMYLEFEKFSSLGTFWVEYQNTSKGWTGAVFNGGDVKPVADGNTFALSYTNNILTFQFVAGKYNGKNSYFTFTSLNADIGDKIIFDDFVIREVNEEFLLDFEGENVGDIAPKQDLSEIMNVYNKSADEVIVKEENGNKFLQVSRENDTGTYVYPIFYFNRIEFLKSFKKYNVTIEFLEHNFTEIYIGYNDSGKGNLTFSSNKFLYSSNGEPYLSNGSFDGKTLSFDLIPSESFGGEYYKQFVVTIKHKNDLLMKIDNVKITSLEEKSKDVIFEKRERFIMEEALKAFPVTVEFELKLPAYIDNTNVIFGNKYYSTNYINYEITNGVPMVVYYDGNRLSKFSFNSVDIRGDNYVNLAIVRDIEAGTFLCYVNGELRQTISCNVPIFETKEPFVVGGDRTSNNLNFFNGSIRSVSVYSDVRETKEIVADLSEVNYYDENILVNYNLQDKRGMKTIEDNCGNNNLYLLPLWCEEEPEKIDFDYSFAVIGDTQVLTLYDSQNLHNIYDYVSENIEEWKVQHVFGLGDITDQDTDEEWILCKEEISKLDNIVPYSLIRGNHDSQEKFNKYFDIESSYSKQYFARYGEDSTNTIHTFTVGNLDYMVVAIDWQASDSVIEWANDIIAKHPKHNVIVTTHIYLDADGTRFNDLTVYDDAHNVMVQYEPNKLHNNLITQHQNIVMVISGHISADGIVMNKTKGIYGNEIVQLLVDPQGLDGEEGSTGLVAYLCFSNEGKDVTVRYYSTIHNKFKSNCDYTFSMNVIEPEDKVIKIELIQPAKDTYLYGEDLDLKNIKIKEIWRSGKEQEIIIEDFVVSGYDKNTLGQKTVKLTKGDFVIEFEVNVIDYVESVEISSLPLKVDYYIGENIDLFGGKLSIKYGSGATEDVSIGKEMIVDFDTSTIGEKTVILEYNDKVLEFKINVVEEQNNHDEPSETPKKGCRGHSECFIFVGLLIVVSLLKYKKAT